MSTSAKDLLKRGIREEDLRDEEEESESESEDIDGSASREGSLDQDLSDLEAEAATGVRSRSGSLGEGDAGQLGRAPLSARSGGSLSHPAVPVGTYDAESESYTYDGSSIEPLDSGQVFLNAFGNALRVFSPTQGTLAHLWGVGWGIGPIATSPAPLVSTLLAPAAPPVPTAAGTGPAAATGQAAPPASPAVQNPVTKIAYAEKGMTPAIRVLEYPSFRGIAMLRGGTTLEFSSIAFSRDGTRIASLGVLPDFRLSVWELESGSDVVAQVDKVAAPCTYVSFDPRNSAILCTSGGGAVAFWSIEMRENVPVIVRRKLPGATVPLDSEKKSVSMSSSTEDKNSQPIDQDKEYTVHCWDTDHRVYVGTNSGAIKLIDPGTGAESLIASASGSITSLVLTKTFLIVGTSLGYIHWIKDGQSVGSTKVCPDPINSIAPDVAYRTLAIGTAGGTIFHIPLSPPAQAQQATPPPKALQRGHTGDITGLGVLPRQNILVTSSLDSSMRLWLFKAKAPQCIWVTQFKTPQTALCCSQVSNIVAIGSKTGFLRIFAIEDVKKPPVLLFRERLHTTQITHLCFHPTQFYLAVGAANGHMCFLATHTSQMKVLGYIDFKAEITGMSWNASEGPNQLFVTAAGCNVFRVAPPERHTDLLLSQKDSQRSVCKLPWTATAIALDPKATGTNRQFYYVLTEDKKLKKYFFPDRLSVDPDAAEDADTSQAKEELKAHEKTGKSLCPSPDGKWMASGGGDGSIHLRPMDNLKKVITLRSMDPARGVVHLCFSSDVKHLFAAGGKSLIRWDFQPAGGERRPQSPKDIILSLSKPFAGAYSAIPDLDDSASDPTPLEMWRRKKVDQEDMAHKRVKEGYVQNLGKVNKWLQELVAANGKPELSADERLTPDELLVNTEERDRLRAEGERRVAALVEQTRLENLERDFLWNKLKAEFYDSQEDHAVVVKGFKKKVEVGNYPLKKRSTEDLQRMRQILLLRRTEVKEHKGRKRELLNQISTDVPGLGTIGHFMGSMRVLELLASGALGPTKTAVVKAKPSKAKLEKVESAAPQAEASAPAPSASAAQPAGAQQPPPTASLAPPQVTPPGTAQPGAQPAPSAAQATAAPGTAQGGEEEDMAPLDDNMKEEDLRELLYHPFDLHTPLRKRTQIQIHQFIVREIKRQYNSDHAKYLEMKRQAIAKIEEKNVRIKEIMEEIKEPVEIWSPSMDESERPESVVSAGKDEQAAQSKQEQNLGDGIPEGMDQDDVDSALRGLKIMMGGKLGSRTNAMEDKEEEQKPEWMNKPTLSEEEKKAVKEWEKRQQTIKEERQKHRKALETELKKIQSLVLEIATSFDDKLSSLLLQRQQTDQATCEEELKVVRLSEALLVQEENEKKEVEIAEALEILKKKKAKAVARLSELKAVFEEARIDYESKLQNDRVIEKSFRRDFEKTEREDVYPVLLRVFRFRKSKNQTAAGGRKGQQPAMDEPKGDHDGDPFQGMAVEAVVPMNAEQNVAALAQQLAQVDEQSLSLGVEKPPEIDEVTWERLLEVRTEKIKSEISVKRAAVRFEEAKAGLRQVQQKAERVKQRLDQMTARATQFKKQQLWDTMNIELFFKVKQGQVEVEQAPVVTRYDESAIIETGRVEELNREIRKLAKEKADILEEIKTTKKLIKKKKWENQGLDMQAQDLQDKTKFLQLLRVTKQLQEFLKEGGEDHQAQELGLLEKRADHEKKNFELKKADLQKKLEKLEQEAAEKRSENDRLRAQIEDLAVSVTERKKIKQIQEQAAKEEETSDKRMGKLLHREKLGQTVKEQARTIEELRQTLDDLRKSTYPLFK